jgi:hypothetical protein
VASAIAGARAEGALAAVDQLMTRYTTLIVAVVLAVLGLLLVVSGIAGL